MPRIVILGPAHPLRGGGITTFNERLAKEFIKEGQDCSIVSFSLQYPSFLFPGKSQYTSVQAPLNLTIYTWINSINPLNWLRVGMKLKKWKPDVVVVRFWIPFMGPALGTIIRQIKKNNHTKIICIADNIIPHEKRPADKSLTHYFLKGCDAFIVMSEKVLSDLRLFESKKPAMLIPHPLYDNFGTPVSKEEGRKRLGLNGQDRIILFFGFIRKYKGLDLLIKAMSDERIKNLNIKLLIAGEFYEDEQFYQQLIDQNNLREFIILRNNFIPDEEVKNYFCACDCIVQPYRNATQSGVTPLAYHFERPMIVTNVGGLPSLVPNEKAGLVCDPEPSSIANAIIKFYSLGEEYFIPHLRIEKQKYNWSNITEAVFKLAEISISK